jgi:hypothetical protein
MGIAPLLSSKKNKAYDIYLSYQKKGKKQNKYIYLKYA